MPRVPLIYPFRGLSEATAVSNQPTETTREDKNTIARCPITRRYVGAQRAGLTKYVPSLINGANPVQRMEELTYSTRNITHTSLGDSVTVERDDPTPSVQDSRNGVTDSEGNLYFFDGNARVVKQSPDGTTLWTIALPAKSPAAICRALCVDSSGIVLIGVSQGGDLDRACMWAYRQVEDDETRILWEIQPGWFTETIVVRNGVLYAAQNNSDTLQSRMAVYGAYVVENPSLTRDWDLPYPTNGHDLDADADTLFTTHEPNTTRGQNPRSPSTTASLIDWTPRNLTSFARRAWGWWASDDLSGDDGENATLDDNTVATSIIDKTGNNRNWVPRVFGSSETGALLIKGGLAGRDVLYFNGLTNSYTTAAVGTTDPSLREVQKTAIPCYAKAQFVMVCVFKMTPEAQARWFFGQNTDDTTANLRGIFVNRQVGSTATSANVSHQVTVFESSTGSGTLADGTNDHPHPGPMDDDGLCVLSWIHDGGQDDITGSPTRSAVRINGKPIDRFKSRAFLPGVLATSLLGVATDAAGTATLPPAGAGTPLRFKGMFCEMLVLADWKTTNADASSVFVNERLITTPDYPDGGFGVGSETEIELIEGYMAHKWGISHKLPIATYAHLQWLLGGPINNDTVTIDGQVYTFKAALTAAAYEVELGANAYEAMLNLTRAVNGTGVEGTNYSAGTLAHPTIRSVGPAYESGLTSFAGGHFVNRSPHGAVFATTESTAGVRMAWTTGPNSDLFTSGGGANGTDASHYPHPYGIARTVYAPGGPPPSDINQDTLVAALKSRHGILAAWDPANGKLLGVLTSGQLNATANNTGYGGIGYSVKCGLTSDVYCMGPRQAAGTFPTISANAVDIRKVKWQGPELGFDVTTAVAAVGPWTDDPGELTYQWPRMAVDVWGNVFCPIHQSGAAISMIGYARTPVALVGVDSANEIVTVTSLTDDPRGYWVAVDPNVPDYAPSFTNTRPEFVYLGGPRPSSSNTNAIHKLRLVSQAQAGLPQRTKVRVAIVNGSAYSFTDAGSTLISASVLDASARFIASATLYSQAFFADGRQYWYYAPRDNVFGRLRARGSNQVPLRGQLMVGYHGRLVIARFDDNPHGWACSAVDNPFDWDTGPPTQTVDQAVSGAASPIGKFPDIITALIKLDDDNLLFGGDSSIGLLRGDPAAGGQIDHRTGGIGIAFGRGHAVDPEGTAYFIGSDGGLYRIDRKFQPVSMSAPRVDDLLRDANLGLYRTELAWSSEFGCLLIAFVAYGAASATTIHYLWEKEADAFRQVTFGTAGLQPTCLLQIDGDAPQDRSLLMGGYDGHVRRWDANAISDDGVRIDSSVILVPATALQSGMEYALSDLEICLQRTQGGADVDVLAATDPNDPGLPWETHRVDPGMNDLIPVSASGNWVGLRLRGRMPLGRWALEHASIDATITGRRRIR